MAYLDEKALIHHLVLNLVAHVSPWPLVRSNIGETLSGSKFFIERSPRVPAKC